ncbi:MAG: NAD-dependent epimerase/dehydratase family protein, partial [Deltaproteobacteria bacterium]|nr:NAD-dependent epimerase/dehydratase family protein [Deltaproteobacteria bacterium]
PASPYAVTKRAGELMLDTFHQLHGLSSACLRFFTVYGPRQRPEMAVHKFARAIDAGEPITVYGDGQSSRDYTYIDDILDGTLGAIDRAPEGCRIYNLGGTNPVTLEDLVRAVGEALGKVPVVRREPHQPGDVLRTWADVERARAELGYDPKVPLRDGLARFARWLRGETRW